MTEDQTLGGYVDAHRCPPAFLGADGVSYTAEIFVEENPDEGKQYGAALLFVRWSPDNKLPDGHLETPFLAHGETSDQARLSVEQFTLYELKAYLDRLIEARKGRPDW